MAIRQYIGARYVPKFYDNPNNTSEWLPNVIYEPLTIVTYGLNSYTSKKTVPASVGDPANNPNYWVATGNFNSQLNEYITLTNNILNDRKIATPEYYGAVGNGINDDTDAIQNCINNNNIVVMNGTYLVSGTLNLHKYTTIIGRGTIYYNVRDNAINCEDDCTIRGITFRDNLDYDSSSGSCIYASEKTNININNVKFDTIGQGCCILCEHSEHIVITHNVFTNYGFSGIMLKDSCKYIDIQFNSLYNSRYMGTQHSYPICFSGYALSEHGPAEFIKCNYNYIEELAPHWEGIDSHACKNCEIIGNVIKNTYGGIMLGDGPTSIPTNYLNVNCNILIADNDITVVSPNVNTLAYGITITNATYSVSKNVVVRDNNISVTNLSNYDTAIVSAISLRGNGTFENIEIKNNNLSLNKAHGISISQPMTISMTIENNYVRNANGGAHYYVINLTSMVSYDNITVINNSIAIIDDDDFRFYNGSSNPPAKNALINYVNNDNNGHSVRTVLYTTSPKDALPNDTKSKGITGQFIPCSTQGTTAGWLCTSTGQWVAISSTIVI